MFKFSLRGFATLLLVLCMAVWFVGCPASNPDTSDDSHSSANGGQDKEGQIPSEGEVPTEGDAPAEGEIPPEGDGIPLDTMTVSLPGNVPMDFFWCPAGTFTMGSPDTEVGRYENETQHQVTLSKGFWLSETEVTQTQWAAVMGSNPSSLTGDALRPVETVSWNDICTAKTGYLDKLNAASPGNGFRLPTEAEWEYAYRAGTTQRFYWGDDLSYAQIGSYAWYGNNSSYTTHPVGTKTANAWGFKDMSGNVWEWCADWYGSYASGAVTDPTGPTTGSYRVLRGGGYYYIGINCRAASRSYNYSADRNAIYGFRVVVPGA